MTRCGSEWRGQGDRCQGCDHYSGWRCRGVPQGIRVSAERVEDIRNHLKEGDAVKAVIVNVDRKNRGINLSIKALDRAEDAAGDAEVQRGQHDHCRNDQPGALLKAKMDTSKADARKECLNDTF